MTLQTQFPKFRHLCVCSPVKLIYKFCNRQWNFNVKHTWSFGVGWSPHKAGSYIQTAELSSSLYWLHGCEVGFRHSGFIYPVYYYKCLPLAFRHLYLYLCIFLLVALFNQKLSGCNSWFHWYQRNFAGFTLAAVFLQLGGFLLMSHFCDHYWIIPFTKIFNVVINLETLKPNILTSKEH